MVSYSYSPYVDFFHIYTDSNTHFFSREPPLEDVAITSTLLVEMHASGQCKGAGACLKPWEEQRVI